MVKSFKFWTNIEILKFADISIVRMIENIKDCPTLKHEPQDRQIKRVSAFGNFLGKMIAECYRNNSAFRQNVLALRFSPEAKPKWEKEWTELFWLNYNQKINIKKNVAQLRRSTRRKTDYARCF